MHQIIYIYHTPTFNKRKIKKFLSLSTTSGLQLDFTCSNVVFPNELDWNESSIGKEIFNVARNNSLVMNYKRWPNW